MRLPNLFGPLATLAYLSSAGWQLSGYRKTSSPRPFYAASGQTQMGECMQFTNKTGGVTLTKTIVLSKFADSDNRCGAWEVDAWSGETYGRCGVEGGEKSFSASGVDYEIGPVDLTAPYVPIKSQNSTCHYRVESKRDSKLSLHHFLLPSPSPKQRQVSSLSVLRSSLAITLPIAQIRQPQDAMNRTPRLRSAFPSSPHSNHSTPQNHGSPRSPPTSSSPKLPDISSLIPSKPEPGAPLVSFDLIDAPSQRLYAFGVFVLLWIWRLYDWSNLMADETESLWLFMKWLVLDLTYLYFLESAHIPWLEFGPLAQTIFFSAHAILNGLLMFRIPIRFLTWLGALMNYLWDSELAISGNSVKYSSLVNNPSLILGRQIIHVLPEGSAILNPDNIPLCLDPSRTSATVSLPLRINQTSPISIELLRYDLETSQNETLTISTSQSRKLRKEALKINNGNEAVPLTLKVPIKQTGLYRLHRIIDETRMDVQLRHSSKALIVACPSASLYTASTDRCRGDLSDVSIQVRGTPPLRVKFRKSLGGTDTGMTYQSIKPDEFASPLIGQGQSGALTVHDRLDLSWAQLHNVKVPLNESLDTVGKWAYSIDEVSDALNNVVNYLNDDSGDGQKSVKSHVEQGLYIHDRPKAKLEGRGLQKPMLAPKGQSVAFPMQFEPSKEKAIADMEHTLMYQFTPVDSITETGDHSSTSEFKEVSIKNTRQRPSVREAGLYTLRSISTPFCGGEVLEPSSFLLTNPPEPDLSIGAEKIADACAERQVGLHVGLDLSGTPPFKIQYLVKHEKQTSLHTKEVSGLRDYIELKPSEAGYYYYQFMKISDAVYREVDLQERNLKLEQDVKPSASAQFTEPSPSRRACIDESVSFDIHFQGQSPFTLEYEIVYGGRRTKEKVEKIETDRFTITTPPLGNGGEYSVVLTGVTDEPGCRTALRQDAKVQVRHQRPKAGFGVVEGKRALRTLEDKVVKIPLRMTGEGPWTVNYRFTDGSTGRTHDKQIPVKDQNELLSIKEAGHYELLSVRDSVCPGAVDESSSIFDVAWIERPIVQLRKTDELAIDGSTGRRRPICEGQDDVQDISFAGRPPYEVTYIERATYPSGQKRESGKKEMHVPLNSAQIKMESKNAGTYEYEFSELGDYNYDHEKKRHKTMTLQQVVHGRPTAVFKNPGKVYSICQSQESDALDAEIDAIHIQFPTGEPPFDLELELTRSGRGARPEILSTHTDRNSKTRDLVYKLKSSRLVPGTSTLTLRRVKDGLGCERLIDPLTSPRVQISVHDLPNIASLEDSTNYCVGERIAFSLSGLAPYTVLYSFNGRERKAVETSPTFRRLAERPGNFSINAVMDSASSCRRPTNIKKVVHPLPSVKLSQGRESRVDIHAGGEAEILFEFGGTPPFEFTYIRSENAVKGHGKAGALLETKTLRSEEMQLKVRAGEEGTYEVVSVRDRYCSFTRPGMEGIVGLGTGAGKLLGNG